MASTRAAAIAQFAVLQIVDVVVVVVVVFAGSDLLREKVTANAMMNASAIRQQIPATTLRQQFCRAIRASSPLSSCGWLFGDIASVSSCVIMID